MKKFIYAIIILLLLIISFGYQKPILTSSEATKQAFSCVKVPSKAKKLGTFPIKEEIEDITDVHTRLKKKSGSFQWFYNQRKWEVTLTFKSEQTTVGINANNGTCIDVSGPLN